MTELEKLKKELTGLIMWQDWHRNDRIKTTKDEMIEQWNDLKEYFEQGFVYDMPKPLTKKNCKYGISAWYTWKIEKVKKEIEKLEKMVDI